MQRTPTFLASLGRFAAADLHDRWAAEMDGETLVFVEVVGFPGGLLTPVRAAAMHENCYRLLEAQWRS